MQFKSTENLLKESDFTLEGMSEIPDDWTVKGDATRGCTLQWKKSSITNKFKNFLFIGYVILPSHSSLSQSLSLPAGSYLLVVEELTLAKNLIVTINGSKYKLSSSKRHTVALSTIHPITRISIENEDTYEVYLQRLKLYKQ